VFKHAIAQTVGTGLVQAEFMSPFVLFAALISAIGWNAITAYFGLPSSSSHALIGGLAGAAFAKGGLAALQLSGFTKVIIAIFLSPLLGLLLSFCLSSFLVKIIKISPKSGNHKIFKGLQLVSSALLSLTHGGNDAQKSMGVIAGVLFSASFLGP